jgi:hypothetical protein
MIDGLPPRAIIQVSSRNNRSCHRCPLDEDDA